MKTLSLWLTFSLCTTAVVAAESDAKSEVKGAVKRLADKPNYSWLSTPKLENEARFRLGPTEGKTEKDGWTHTVVSFNDNTVESVFKGRKAALKREDEWQTLEELETGDSAWIGRLLKAFKALAAEAVDLADQAGQLKKGEDGAYSGDLTPDGAKTQLMRRTRQGANAPVDAKGWVKFWIQDGLLVKYQFNLQGTVTRQNGEEQKLDRTTTVEIKDVGTTTVTVPAEVKKKLS
jgi:hypothetical protein